MFPHGWKHSCHLQPSETAPNQPTPMTCWHVELNCSGCRDYKGSGWLLYDFQYRWLAAARGNCGSWGHRDVSLLNDTVCKPANLETPMYSPPSKDGPPKESRRPKRKSAPQVSNSYKKPRNVAREKQWRSSVCFPFSYNGKCTKNKCEFLHVCYDSEGPHHPVSLPKEGHIANAHQLNSGARSTPFLACLGMWSSEKNHLSCPSLFTHHSLHIHHHMYPHILTALSPSWELIEAIMFLYCHCIDPPWKNYFIGRETSRMKCTYIYQTYCTWKCGLNPGVPRLCGRSLLTTFKKWFTWEALLQPQLDQQLKEFILRGLKIGFT